MNVSIRKYCEKDLPEMIKIWNEVVEEGIAFHRKNCLQKNQAHSFLLDRLTALLHKAVMITKFTDFIFCIQTMSAVAVIFVMQAMQSQKNSADFISAKNL
mgnify:CR=1 FL=1